MQRDFSDRVLYRDRVVIGVTLLVVAALSLLMLDGWRSAVVAALFAIAGALSLSAARICARLSCDPELRTMRWSVSPKVVALATASVFLVGSDVGNALGGPAAWTGTDPLNASIGWYGWNGVLLVDMGAQPFSLGGAGAQFLIHGDPPSDPASEAYAADLVEYQSEVTTDIAAVTGQLLPAGSWFPGAPIANHGTPAGFHRMGVKHTEDAAVLLRPRREWCEAERAGGCAAAGALPGDVAGPPYARDIPVGETPATDTFASIWNLAMKGRDPTEVFAVWEDPTTRTCFSEPWCKGPIPAAQVQAAIVESTKVSAEQYCYRCGPPTASEMKQRSILAYCRPGQWYPCAKTPPTPFGNGTTDDVFDPLSVGAARGVNTVTSRYAGW